MGKPFAGPARFASIAVAVLGLISALAACGSDENKADALSGFTRTPALNVAGISLPDVSPGGGSKSMLRADRGKVLLVYFGYTYCPDVCPTTLSDVASGIRQLPRPARDRVEVGMVTVDPERDTAKVLNRYLGHFFDSWRAYRTTDGAELGRAEKAFRASHEVGPKRPDGNYDVTHTAVTYLVDPGGVVRVEWPFGTQPDAIASDLKRFVPGARDEQN